MCSVHTVDGNLVIKAGRLPKGHKSTPWRIEISCIHSRLGSYMTAYVCQNTCTCKWKWVGFSYLSDNSVNLIFFKSILWRHSMTILLFHNYSICCVI